MNSMCFITAGSKAWASSRFRAYWPAQYIEGATVITLADAKANGLPEAQVYVWQKVADPDVMEAQREAGALVYWDVCDPMWWFNPRNSINAATAADAIVCSNDGLARDFEDWSGIPARVIGDRFELTHYDRWRTHEQVEPVRLIWFGVSQNRAALHGALPNLFRLDANGYDITLTIMDDRPDVPMYEVEGYFPVHYTRWSLGNEVRQLSHHDIALLPPYPGPWGNVKSNNKRDTAALCGLPVSAGLDYEALRALVSDWQVRVGFGAAGRASVREQGDVALSAMQWQEMVQEGAI